MQLKPNYAPLLGRFAWKHRIKKSPSEEGLSCISQIVGVLVTQLTVVSKENQQVGGTDDAIPIEIFSTRVL